jgi:phosphatidylserine/phosphatidylglycerophosphate/cardiolipin synthase-like enzyme
MSDFANRHTKKGFTVKLWRGERMCLLGFDVAQPEPDLVGFAIECREPGKAHYEPLKNRLAFSYPQPDPAVAVTGARQFSSLEAPFQKFRWIHFPHDPRPGKYKYRATKIHMPADDTLKKGTQIVLDVQLDPETYDGFLDVGFTRNFASSQAYAERYLGKLPGDPIPGTADEGLDFAKLPNTDVYDWLGFEAYDLLFGLLDEAVEAPDITVDALAYDLNEPDIVARLEKLKTRLRMIVDDSGDKTKNKGHVATTSAETRAAARLATSSGGKARRTNFSGLQHHKVFILKRDGIPYKVLIGSTNFSFRGLYIQANNLLIFEDRDITALYAQMFERVFADPDGFKNDPIASKWHFFQAPGRPAVHVCFSPHKDADVSLNPVRGAIDQASSSVFYSVAFLSQIKTGPTREAFDRLMARPVFSYGTSDEAGGMEVHKPDGTKGLVDFAYLAENAPEPFKREWSGGQGINIHHKFVVTDFSLPSAKVYTGSSNLSPSGEKGNGDHLVLIEDQKVATGFALEAVRVFDHLHFRTRMQDASKEKDKTKKKEALTLRKPSAITNRAAWFESSYKAASQRELDRRLFST